MERCAREAIADRGARHGTRSGSLQADPTGSPAQEVILVHFRGPSPRPRACAWGVLVARTGRPEAPERPILHFPGHMLLP